MDGIWLLFFMPYAAHREVHIESFQIPMSNQDKNNSKSETNDYFFNYLRILKILATT